ncbi:MAG TPA: DUF3795 domain-containing protein [Thermoplasmata archaeon]|nr:MAG TPA: DUF3795 domain-containing protein [Thermoplasmata archaeon]
MKRSLLTPCGINCRVCIAYLREKNRCLGCRIDTSDKPVTRAQCKIKNCDELQKNNLKFCFDCKKFPCDLIKRMDKRYRTRYNMSTIENLKNLKKMGVREFVKNEKIRWTCSHCGGTICVHRGCCYACGKKPSD